MLHLLQRAIFLPESIDGGRLVAQQRFAARARRAAAKLGGVVAVLGITGDAARRLAGRCWRRRRARRSAADRPEARSTRRPARASRPGRPTTNSWPLRCPSTLASPTRVRKHAGCELDDLVAGAMAERRDDAAEAVECRCSRRPASCRARSRRATGRRRARGSAGPTGCRDAPDGRCAARDRRSLACIALKLPASSPNSSAVVRCRSARCRHLRACGVPLRRDAARAASRS